MELKVLTEERAEVVKRMQERAAKWEREGNYTTEEREQHEQDNRRQNELNDKIDMVQKINEARALSRSADYVERQERPQLNHNTEDKQRLTLQAWVHYHNDNHQYITREMRRAADDAGFDLAQKSFTYRDQSLGGGSPAGEQGGFLSNANTSLFSGLEKHLPYYAGILNYANVEPVTEWQTVFRAFNDDSANAADFVDELGTTTGTATELTKTDIALGKLSTGIMDVSSESLQTAKGLENLIYQNIGERFGRKINSHTSTGSRTNNRGFMLDASDSGVTCANQTLVDTDEILDLISSVDPSYADDPSAALFMNYNTWRLIRKTRNAVDDYVVGGLQGKARREFDGYPVIICTGMADAASGTKPIAFGAANRFIIRTGNAIRFKVLNELLAEKDAVGYLAFYPLGCRLVNTNAIKYLTMAA